MWEVRHLKIVKYPMNASVNLSINSASRIFIALMGFIHMGAIVCVLFLDIFLWIKLGFVAVIIINFIYTLYRNVLQHKKSIVKVWQVTSGEWQLVTHKGELLKAHLRGDSVVTRYLIILNFSLQGTWRRKTLLLFPDMFDRQTFRRLRVQLLSNG